MEPPVPEQYEFENRVKRRNLAFFGIFGRSDFQCRNQMFGVSIYSFSSSVKLSISTLMEEMRSVVFEQFKFEHRDEYILTDLFSKFRTIRNMTPRPPQSGFKTNPPLEECFLIDNLIEEIKPVVFKNFELEKGDKWIIRSLVSNFGLSRLWSKEQNHGVFKRSTPVQVECFRFFCGRTNVFLIFRKLFRISILFLFLR